MFLWSVGCILIQVGCVLVHVGCIVHIGYVHFVLQKGKNPTKTCTKLSLALLWYTHSIVQYIQVISTSKGVGFNRTYILGESQPSNDYMAACNTNLWWDVNSSSTCMYAHTFVCFSLFCYENFFKYLPLHNMMHKLLVIPRKYHHPLYSLHAHYWTARWMHDLVVKCHTTLKPPNRSWPARPADLVQAHAATTSHTVMITQTHNMNTITGLTLNRRS